MSKDYEVRGRSCAGEQGKLLSQRTEKTWKMCLYGEKVGVGGCAGRYSLHKEVGLGNG